ncbi:transmembrane protease serine 11D-like isoform X3 [Daphnia pulicaria]|uniref:transmembrane protease serine 11D-like isoform X3 n=1 Tax=Daphnia pulicaria TaxID=35523 RepID=UPI001EEB0DAB|nr:transmembrane protease serine 11D-like isoform X3 [Daphnia pulicaria]
MLFRTYTSNSGLSRRVDSIQTREGIETVTSTEITSSLHHAFQLSCNCQGMMRTRMMGDRKDFPTVFIFTFAVVLSCCQASSSFLPHVTRTSDAVIIDFPDAQTASPNMRQGVPPTTTTTTTPAPATTPAIQCGRGPTRFPVHHHHRSLISERKRDETNEAKKNSWPFMVHLSPIMLIGEPCSGVLISDTKVLLAAQCLERMPSIFPMILTVLTGVHSIYPSDAQMTRRVARAVLHGKYNAGNYANDIAIVTLDAPVIFSKTVGPVCLPPASTDPDQYSDLDAVALGWGTAELGYPSATLQQATVGMLPKYLCREEDYFGKYISELNICVKSNDEENLQCVCDLGGPVVVQTSPGIWTVIGINSFAKDCGVGGLKTRVSAFRTWIDQNI